MTTVKFKGQITLEQLRVLISNPNQANLLWGGLKKHGISTWEELADFRRGLKAGVKRLLAHHFPENSCDYRVETTIFGVSVYTVEKATYKKRPLPAVIGNTLNRNFPSIAVACNTQHLERGQRVPAFNKLCYLSPVLIANGEWHKTSTKSEILSRY